VQARAKRMRAEGDRRQLTVGFTASLEPNLAEGHEEPDKPPDAGEHHTLMTECTDPDGFRGPGRWGIAAGQGPFHAPAGLDAPIPTGAARRRKIRSCFEHVFDTNLIGTSQPRPGR